MNKEKKVLLTPNQLSMVRILMIPLFCVFFYVTAIPYNYFWSAVVFTVAALTDFLDGYVARKYNLVTDLGKFLDAIADKVLVLTAFVLMLTVNGMYGKYVWIGYYSRERTYRVVFQNDCGEKRACHRCGYDRKNQDEFSGFRNSFPSCKRKLFRTYKSVGSAAYNRICIIRDSGNNDGYFGYFLFCEK